MLTCMHIGTIDAHMYAYWYRNPPIYSSKIIVAVSLVIEEYQNYILKQSKYH